VRVGLGFVYPAAAYPVADQRSTLSLLGGVIKRLCKAPPPKNQEMFRALCEYSMGYIKARFNPVPVDYDISYQTWLESTNYPQARKEELRKLHDDSQQSVKPFSHAKCFQKDEAYSGYKFPRGIYSRSDWVKNEFGPFFSAIESSIFRDPHYIKHVATADRARFIRRRLCNKGSKVIATDYTAFESHFVADVFREIEVPIYKYMTQHLEGSARFHALLDKLSERNKCKFFNKFNVDIDATRLSGERNTSVGNGLVNLLMFEFLADSKGWKNFDCVVEGDDLVGVFDGDYTTEEDYASLGFTIKIEKPERVEEAAFCQLIFDEDDRVLCDPIKILLKMPWISGRYSHSSEKLKKRLLRGKAMCTLSDFPACPVVSAYCRMLLRHTGEHYTLNSALNPYEKRIAKNSIKNFEDGNVQITQSSRFLMEKVYKVTVDHQIFLEKYFDSTSNYADILQIPLLDIYVSKQQQHYAQVYVHCTNETLTRAVMGVDLETVVLTYSQDGREHDVRLFLP